MSQLLPANMNNWLACKDASRTSTLHSLMTVEGGILPEFKWNFRKFKEGLKDKKKVIERHLVYRPQNGTPVGGQLFGVHLSKTTNLRNFLFPSILLIL